MCSCNAAVSAAAEVDFTNSAFLVGCLIFTALHGMQSRYSDGISVCPSVKRVHCDKTEENSVHIFIPRDR